MSTDRERYLAGPVAGPSLQASAPAPVPHVATPPTVAAPQAKRDTAQWVRIARLLIGLGGAAALLLEYTNAQSDIDRATKVPDISAVQIVQLWTPHIFYAIVIIGVTLALYIATRMAD